MRTIKFKGKRLQNGEWVLGSLLQVSQKECYIVVYNDDGYIRYEVDPETVCQFTGLHDKDGKEIYEDDIVEFVDINLPDCVIVYDNGSFMYRELGEDISTEELRIQFTVEVIGNIHDNPELLKGGSI